MSWQKLSDIVKRLDLKDEPSPFQNREARMQKQHNWNSLRGWGTKFVKAIDDYLTNVDQRIDEQLNANTFKDEEVDFRHSDMLQSSFKTMRKRGDFWDDEMQGRGVNPRWFHTGRTSTENAITQAVQVAAEFNLPVILTEDYTTGSFTIKDSVLIIGNGHTLTTKESGSTIENFITVEANEGDTSPTVDIKDLKLVNTSKYNVGLFNNDARVNMNNVTVTGFTQKDIYYQKGHVNGGGHLSFIWCEESQVGLDLETTDVKVDHFQGKNCMTHIDGVRGNDFLTDIHGWNMIDGETDWVNGSRFLNILGSCIINNAFADTVETAFNLSEITSPYALVSVQNSIYFTNKSFYPNRAPKLFSSLADYPGQLNVNGMEVDANGWQDGNGKPEVVTGPIDKSRITIGGLTSNGFLDSHHIAPFYTTEQNFYAVLDDIIANFGYHRFYVHQGEGYLYFGGGIKRKIAAGEKIGQIRITANIASVIDVYSITGTAINKDGKVLPVGVDFDTNSQKITIYNCTDETYSGSIKIQMSFIASKY